MNNPLDVSHIRSNPEVVGSIPTEVKRFFLYLVWFPDSLYYRANAQWVSIST